MTQPKWELIYQALILASDTLDLDSRDYSAAREKIEQAIAELRKPQEAIPWKKENLDHLKMTDPKLFDEDSDYTRGWKRGRQNGWNDFIEAHGNLIKTQKDERFYSLFKEIYYEAYTDEMSGHLELLLNEAEELLDINYE